MHGMNSENKNLILNTAVSLFSAKGYEGVGVQEICTESNITKPTLYYYFSSKTGLLSAIIENLGESLYGRLEKASEYRHDFIKSLGDILCAEIEAAQENPDFFRLHCALSTASEESEGGKLYRAFSERLEKLYEGFFIQSVNEIGNMRGKERLYSRIFQCNCRAVALDYINGKIQGDGQACENQVADTSTAADVQPNLQPLVHSIVHAFAYGVVNG